MDERPEWSDLPPRVARRLRALGPVERVIIGTVGTYHVAIRQTLGRGTTVDVDDERYLPEALVKELGRFYAWTIPAALLGAFLLGIYLGFLLFA